MRVPTIVRSPRVDRARRGARVAIERHRASRKVMPRLAIRDGVLDRARASCAARAPCGALVASTSVRRRTRVGGLDSPSAWSYADRARTRL